MFETIFTISDQGNNISAQEASDTMNKVPIAAMQSMLGAEVSLWKIYFVGKTLSNNEINVSAFEMQCHILKNTLLHTTFSAIFPAKKVIKFLII